MKRIFKQSTVLLAALLCCVFLLTGCGDDQASSTATPAPTGSAQPGQSAENTPVSQENYMGEGIFRVEGEEEEFSYLIPGTEVRLYHWWFTGNEGRDEGFLSDGLVGRHRGSVYDQLKEEYDINITFVPAQGTDLWPTVWQSTYAGTPIVDGMHGGGASMLLDHVYYEGSEGLIIEPIDNKGISFDDEAFWAVTQMETYARINGKMYAFMFNNIGMKKLEANVVMFMNNNLVNDSSYTVDEIYDMVRNNEWNWDNFRQVLAAVSNPDNGIYGFNYYGAVSFLGLSNGGEIVAPQEIDGTTVDRLVGNNDAAWKAGWDFVTGLYQQNLLAPREGSTWDQAAMQDFSTGQTAFMINWFNRSDAISAAAPQLEYGYLPVPNGPNTQDSGRYYSQGPLGECFYMLKNPKNTTEDYSCILKVMKELYRPVYGIGWKQETALWESEVANYAKDEDMLEMCNLLVDSTFYPAHLKYANMEHLVVQDTVVYRILVGETTFAQYWDSQVDVYNTMIDDALRR